MAVRKFKEGGRNRRIRNGKASQEDLQEPEPNQVKFSTFQVTLIDEVSDEVVGEDNS